MAKEPRRFRILKVKHWKELGKDQAFVGKLIMTGIGAAAIALGITFGASTLFTAFAGGFMGVGVKGIVDKIKEKIGVVKQEEQGQDQEETNEETEEQTEARGR